MPARAASHGGEGRAWRVAVDDAPIAFADRLQGRQQQRLDRDVGDFVVRRADGLFAYQLAVVVDDAMQGITDVVRGADLLASTPRQIWLQRQLGFATPAYLHHPIAIDRSGRQAVQGDRRGAAARRPAAGACGAPGVFSDSLLPERRPRSVADSGAWRIAPWDARALPPVAMLPADADAASQPFAR